MTIEKPKILVLCTGNSARSQMAEGIFRDFCGDEFEIYSAGTNPSIVREEAIEVLNEIGIDISNQRSKNVGEFAGSEFEFVLTVCENARESCPYFPAKTKLIHRGFEDPAVVEGTFDERMESFRKVRDEIRDFVPEFVESIR